MKVHAGDIQQIQTSCVAVIKHHLLSLLMICHVSVVGVTEGYLFNLWERVEMKLADCKWTQSLWIFGRNQCLRGPTGRCEHYGQLNSQSNIKWGTLKLIAHYKEHPFCEWDIVRRLSQLPYLQSFYWCFQSNSIIQHSMAKYLKRNPHDKHVTLTFKGPSVSNCYYMSLLCCCVFLLDWGWAATHGYLNKQLSENSKIPCYITRWWFIQHDTCFSKKQAKLIKSKVDFSPFNGSWVAGRLRHFLASHSIRPVKPDVVSSYFIWPIPKF